MKTRSVQRNTRQRQMILEELQKLTSHPTAATLFEIVRRRLPKVSLGTVYRNLDLLARLGLIQKLDSSGAEARFDGNVEHHDHLRCVMCGRVDDVSAPALDLLGGQTNDWGGYRILGHRLEFLGICPNCGSQVTEDTTYCEGTSTELLVRRRAAVSASGAQKTAADTPSRDNAFVFRKPR
jgi:Fur family transcriptional regulator, ferric uptake regulator